MRLETTDISFVIPANWKVPGVAFNASGVGTLGSSTIRIDSPDATVLVIVNVRTGLAQAIVNDKPVTLRGEGPAGQPIELASLATLAGQSYPALFRLVESIELVTPATSATEAQT